MEAIEEFTPEDLGTTQPDLDALRGDWRSLKEHSADVAERYKKKKAELDELIELKERFWANQNAELIKEYEEITGAFKSIDSQLRSAVVAAYDANPERKTVAAGLSVRVSEKVVTTDVKARLAWVKENAPVCLVVDDDAFAKLIKAMTPDSRPEFIKIEEKVTAVISETK